MNKIKLWYVLLIILQANRKTQSLTHWVVTENGRIQPKLESQYYLRRPYDLVALLEQETRSADLDVLVEDLVEHTNRIEEKSSKASSDSELMIDDTCDILNVKDQYHPISTNGSDRIKFKLADISKLKSLDYEPHCVKYSKLEYSLISYDHLESIQNRKDFKMLPFTMMEENLLKNKEIGQQIAFGLSKNSSSWIYYNMALLYWWQKGDGFEAIECARRALHFAPKEYKDIPLLNLGGILYWGWNSKEAIILLKAAVDHAPFEPKNYLSLGHVYGNFKEYAKTMKCYRRFNKLAPKSEYVKLTSKFIKCIKLHTGLLEYQDTLQDLLSDLHEFHNRQQKWLTLQKRLMWEVAPYELQFPVEKAKHFIDLQGGHSCMPVLNSDQVPTIKCDFSKKTQHYGPNLQSMLSLAQEANVDIENIPSTEFKEVKTEAETVNKIMLDFNKENERIAPTLLPKYPTSMNLNNNLPFDSAKWPTRDECLEWNLPLNEEENLEFPVFIPLENKGFEISKILSEDIGLPSGTDHELPWYPPLCEHPNEFEDYILSALTRAMVKNKPLGTHEAFREHFLKYVNEGKAEEAEIGQRIITAVKKKSGPSWLLAVMASMYWRVRSNTKNALTCLDMPIDSVESEFTDVILVSLGSMFQQLGLIESALTLATFAFKVNYLEPSTNFLLALIHYQKNNPILAMYYLKNVLRVDPGYYQGEADWLLKLWACRIKLGGTPVPPNLKIDENLDKSEVCGERVEPNDRDERDGFSSEGIICSANGEQCKTAAIQCFRTDTKKYDGVKPVSSEQCDNDLSAGSLLASLEEGSGGAEPDQSQLENFFAMPQDFQMRIYFDGDDSSHTSVFAYGDFYVSFSISAPELILYVYDKSGTYTVSKSRCHNIRDADWLHFSSMWQSIASRNVNIASFLDPLPINVKEFERPRCSDTMSPSSAKLDQLTKALLEKHLPNVAEEDLSEGLGLMAEDQEATVRELGAKIGIALKKNTTSWILATAAAFYWRVVGNTEEAVTCLRQALTYAPSDMKDIPLISLANLLHRIGLLKNALQVAYITLENHPDFVVNHFTAGNIHTSMGEYEKAVAFYRSSLSLDANFEPARNRLTFILCTLLLDEGGRLQKLPSNDIYS